MQLTEEQITQFQKLYKKHFGEDISKEQAHEEGIKLKHLMQLIYKPMTKAEYEEVQRRRRMEKNFKRGPPES